ncbi:hypothetical protein G6O69_08005 [Pseudenhygromyxa sp. WMMC2535]|uniref:hypothetical protein n=1 Tax=Pseudenhygromyxa sp. WMMC2535 TaxID=2712867 RepID=UPI001551CB20|nr:hypothetical protein [Pseudenhygromyxa sp. WMMC2535]NVB37773.1 hypothetical protein [Pseudenhygromyxa sp. WMMC2535]
MSPLPWTLLGLPADFELEHLELVLARDPEALPATEEGGVVSKDETVNHRSFHGALGGLFDEGIFGALATGDPRAQLHAEYESLPADDEPATPAPRRDRFGVIELAEPMLHPAFCVADPSWLHARTGLDRKAVGMLQRRDAALVISGEGFTVGELVTAERLGELGDDTPTVVSGPSAITWALERAGEDQSPIITRLRVLPVQLRLIPPGPEGRFETSDIDEHYLRVINRNNRLARLLELDAPGIILRNERRALIEIVERLFFNQLCDEPLVGANMAMLQGLHDLAGGETLDEQLRALDASVGQRGLALLSRGEASSEASAPSWSSLVTLRGLQAMGFGLRPRATQS